MDGSEELYGEVLGQVLQGQVLKLGGWYEVDCRKSDLSMDV